MKKLMLTVAALATGAVLADSSIASANVVGYSTQDHGDKQFVCIAVGFQNVSTPDVFKMSDINVIQMSDTSDIIQKLEPTRARTEKMYFSYNGTWYEGDDWTVSNDDQFDVGTGFLANFAAKDAQYTVSGSVLQGATELDYTGLQFVMVGNPLPRAVKFSEIEPVSFSDTSDILQRLESTRARTVKMYFAYNGNWYEGDDWNDASDDEIAAGEALLGNFASKKVKITFPSAL